jgi:hypothetical protein
MSEELKKCQFCGIEQDDKYYEIAKKRIREAEDACGLFT